VQHAHIHIVPRYPGDLLRPSHLSDFLPGSGRDE
jgi:diadenosine tetraphosphate (Ap4A) HIT family hydrolase